MQHGHEAIGVSIWKRPERDRVEDRVDGGGRADAHCKRQECDERERRRADKHARGVDEFTLCVAEAFAHRAAGVRRRINALDFRLDMGAIAEAARGLAFGVFAGHTARDEFLDAAFEMKTQLGVDIAVHAIARERKAKEAFHADGSLGGEHHRCGLRVSLPTRETRGEMFSPAGGQLVVFRAPVRVRDAPFAVEPSLLLHPVERGVERAFFDLKSRLGDLLDPAQDREPVHRAPGQGLQDEEVEGTADEVEVFGHEWLLA